jgi:hypothetical protein
LCVCILEIGRFEALELTFEVAGHPGEVLQGWSRNWTGHLQELNKITHKSSLLKTFQFNLKELTNERKEYIWHII